MKIESRKLKDLVPYDKNPRQNDGPAVESVLESLRRHDQVKPIVLSSEGHPFDGEVICCGHTTVKALEKFGAKTVQVVLKDFDDEADFVDYNIRDNRTGEVSDWDEPVLAELAAAFEIDLSEMGFELDVGMEGTDGLTDEDEVPEDVEPVCKLGDVWKLGEHRLMCGDSTIDVDVDALMDGSGVDMIFTDPPYNVAFNGRSGKHSVIMNDNISDDDFLKLIDGTISTIKRINPKAYYIWCNWSFYGILQGKLDYKSCIVWAKNVFGMGNGYRHQHEFCLFGGKIDEHIKNESDLWEIKKDSKYVHPTQKPVALSVRAFSNHIKYKTVLDLFGGSGSTLIGAEQTGRKAYLLELDPKYCDVIIKRWEDFTGKKAEKL